jgi:hypothetical protein
MVDRLVHGRDRLEQKGEEQLAPHAAQQLQPADRRHPGGGGAQQRSA